MSEIWTMGELLVEIMRPKPDIELYEKSEFQGPYPSGAPAIFIDTAARLGHSTGIIGGVGEDDFGKCLLDRLTKDGVDCSQVITVPGLSTAVAFVTYFDDGSRKFIYHIGNTPAAMAKSPDISKIKEPKWLHITGCSLMANEDFYKEIIVTMRKFSEQGAKISFDPNIREELLLGRDINNIVASVMENCSVLLPGTEELLLITGEKTIEQAVKKAFQYKNMEIIALKQGMDGCTIFTKEGSFSLGVFPVEPIDPTGAGDCFDAGFVCSLLEGKSLEECAAVASAVAACNTAAFGPMEGNIDIETVRGMIEGGIVHA